MKCEICGEENLDVTFLLPIKTNDGKLETSACKKCGMASSAYCKKHQRIHAGFGDNTNACTLCIEDQVFSQKPTSWFILPLVIVAITPMEKRRLNKEVMAAAALLPDFDPGTMLLRLILTKAMRTKQSCAQVIQEIIHSHSIDYILT